MKKTIILYNPAAPYYTMPLQFLALASVIDRERYDVKIIDARIERSPRTAHEKLKLLLPNAVCVGISVITGTPIKDAVSATRLVKKFAPQVPVVWGGWHPSIYPEQCMREGGADFCIFGQGEMTFLDLLSAIEYASRLDEIPGLAYMEKQEFRQNAERKFIDINNFPGYDYSLIPVERYFHLKGMRQIDFYSSQGCPYRCAFCADPFVYNRRWSGLKGSRMLFDVFEAVRTYGASDVLFQDENFFANKHRVMEFCDGMVREKGSFTWAATSRADQIAPLDDDVLRKVAGANLRKVIIGAESGSQQMLDFMKKDTLAEESLISAEKLSRHGIGAIFGFIVGFPEEGFDNTLQTLKTIKEIKRIDPRFEFNIFFFTPYPGTELFNYIVNKGYRVPQSLDQWSDIDFTLYSGYWVKHHEREYVERFKFYAKFSTEPQWGLMRPLQYLAALRTNRNYFDYPLEKELVNFVRYRVLHRVNW